MNKMKFQISINAKKEKVWDMLWQDSTFRQWASIIDPGTYMVGDLKEGNEIQFISAENGYGVTSLVAEINEPKYLLLKHTSDTQKNGEEDREKEWTGGEESYSLSESDNCTTLTVEFDVPTEMEQYFNENFPKALAKIKQLSE